MWHKYHFSTPLSQIRLAAARVFAKERSGEIVYETEHEQHKADVAILLLRVQPMMTALCAHSSSKYCTLTFLSSLICFCIFLAVSFRCYRIPCVALSASVIDRHAGWQIDHYSHRRLWPSTTPSSFLSLLICLGDVFGLECPNHRLHIWYSPSVFAFLPPACGQLSRRRTIRLMFLLLASSFMWCWNCGSKSKCRHVGYPPPPFFW